MKLRWFLLSLLLALPAIGEPQPQLPVTAGYEHQVLISPDARNVLLAASKDVWLWDAETFKLKRKMQNLERVYTQQFSPDGRYLAVSDYPRWFGLFDVRGSNYEKSWEFRDTWNQPGEKQDAGAYEAHFSSDGKYLLLIGGAHGAQQADHVVRLLRTSDGKVLREYPYWGGGRRYDSYRNFAFSDYPDGFLRASHDKLQLLEVPSGEKVREVRVGGEVTGVKPWEGGVAVHHYVDGGTRHVLSHYEVPSLKLLQRCGSDEVFPRQTVGGDLRWERSDGKLSVLKGKKVVYQGRETDRVRRWVPGGGFVIETDSEKELLLFDQEGKKLGLLDAFSSFKGPLALAVPGYGGPGEVVDLKSGKKIGKFEFTSGMNLSTDGKMLAVALKNGVLLIDIPASIKAGSLVPAKKK